MTLLELILPETPRFHHDKHEIQSYFGAELIFAEDKIEFRAYSRVVPRPDSMKQRLGTFFLRQEALFSTESF